MKPLEKELSYNIFKSGYYKVQDQTSSQVLNYVMRMEELIWLQEGNIKDNIISYIQDD